MPKKTSEEKNKRNLKILQRLLDESGGLSSSDNYEVNEKDGVKISSIEVYTDMLDKEN